MKDVNRKMDAYGGICLLCFKYEGLHVLAVFGVGHITSNVENAFFSYLKNAIRGVQKLQDMNGIQMPMEVHICLVFSTKALMYGQILYMFNTLWNVN